MSFLRPGRVSFDELSNAPEQAYVLQVTVVLAVC
jgi:hypothetical protein